MTEDEARAIVADRVGPVAVERLGMLAELVTAENERQNLVSPATLPAIWSRHILDSVQLLAWAPALWRCWLDVGTGGGFPGLAIAACVSHPMLLVEPRRRRADFLAASARALGLDHVVVEQCNVEVITAEADVISARAVASVEKLLRAARHCSTTGTRWLLPRGRLDPGDVTALRAAWKGVFHVEHSVSDPASAILIVTGVSAR